MFSRISKVENLSTKTLFFSSTLQIGDTSYIDGNSEAFAVQRQGEFFLGKEGDELPYPIFYSPSFFLPIDETVTTNFINKNPFIEVGNVKFIGISSASVIAVGNVGHARMRSRVKHIRQLLNGKSPNNPRPISSNQNSGVRNSD